MSVRDSSRARSPAAPPRASELHHASDARPGITRLRRGRGFAYRDPHGAPLRDPRTLARIRALAIPPAWREVWISPDPRGHVQATGRDARGRKQYRYHPRWRELRDATKFHRLAAFARALPAIRRRVRSDLRRRGLPRDKVLAALVRLLEASGARVGNEEYARQNHSYGLTTLRDRHASFSRAALRLRFRGKGGKEQTVELHDARVARIVRRAQELPGQQLFQYLGQGGRRRSVGSADVNAYLRDAAQGEFSAKDFRTWTGSLLAMQVLRARGSARGRRASERAIVACVDRVARELGNTRAVCRRFYVHPAVFEAYREGRLEERRSAGAPRELAGDERLLLGLLAQNDRARRPRGSRRAPRAARPG